MAFDNSDQPGKADCIDELLPGTALLAGQYRVTRFLSSGGFGITYLAKDGLDRDVVLKECFVEAICKRQQSRVLTRSESHRAHLQRAVADFTQEARTVASLSHPNIVRIHQYFQENDTAYMALDYIVGHDLFEVIDDRKMSLAPDQIVSIARKLISAVAHIHDRGLVHCDISPDNVCLTRSGEPVLIDFGAARSLVGAVAQKRSAFTLVKDGYSPHELYESAGSCGTYTDVYALAATLYYAITGTAPIDSETRLRTILAERPDPLQPLAGSFDGYPPGFLASIDKALAVEPFARFRSAQDWLDALARPQPTVVVPRHPLRPTDLAVRDATTRDRSVVLMRRMAMPAGPGRQVQGL